jgi:putative transposase
MRKSKFTEEEIVGILRETDRDPVATVAKRHGVSEQAIYTLKKRFGAFQPDDVRRLMQLEVENARLKKLVAKRDLELEVMKEIAAKNGRPAGSSRAGGVRDAARGVAAPVVRASESRPLGRELPLGEGRAGRSGGGAHGGAGRAVSALRLPSIRIFLDREAMP